MYFKRSPLTESWYRWGLHRLLHPCQQGHLSRPQVRSLFSICSLEWVFQTILCSPCPKDRLQVPLPPHAGCPTLVSPAIQTEDQQKCLLFPWECPKINNPAGDIDFKSQICSCHFFLDLKMKKLRVFSQVWSATKGFKTSVYATVVWGHRVGRGWARSYARVPFGERQPCSPTHILALLCLELYNQLS